MASPEERPGIRPSVLGRYELITQIGQGGMAEVQLAIQRGPAGFEKLVVVKLVHERLATERAFVDMLLDEARVAAMLKHPNVVDIYDLGQVDGRYFIAMEYLEGEPLLSVLRAGRDGKRLDPLSTARMLADAAEGLHAAHELSSFAGEALELVHHDVSLGNIVVLYNGQVKLVDFGVAKAAQSAAPIGKLQGKFSYMAPEKLRGGGGDRRSDIFSLGIVAWEAMTLRRLFKGGNDSDTMKQVLELEIPPPSSANDEVPAAFDPIIMKALEREPDKRFATAGDMARELEEVLREHKYGGKNELIARYMQTTFAQKITARKKLLQEVASKGRASAEVLDAAFQETAIASGSPVPHPHGHTEFSVKFRISEPRPAVAPAEDPAPADAQPADAEPADATATDEPASEPASEPADAHSAHTAGSSRPDLTLDGGGTTANTTSRSKLYVALGAGFAVALALGVIMLGRGNEAERSSQAGAPSPQPVATIDAPTDGPETIQEEPTPEAVLEEPTGEEPTGEEPTDEGPGAADAKVPPVQTSTSGATSEQQRGSHGSVGNTARPRGPSAQELFKTGMQAYVQGNSRGAVASFRRAVQAKPGYAAAWRALGIAHEKLGERSKAKSSFQRYLQLAPDANDAPQIRARLENL